MEHNKTTVLLSLILVLLVACYNDYKKKKVTKQIEKWQGKEIKFPDNLLYSKYARDTLVYRIPDTNYKILLYIDSIGCSTCKLNFNKWKQVIKEIDSLTNKNVAFLFFFQTKKMRNLQYLLRYDGIDFPVYIDTENKFNKLNNFSNNPSFQCFLLDKQNKVIGIGNPAYNNKIKDFYISQITGKKYTKQTVLTTTANLISPQTIEFGSFNKSETKSCEIIVKNTGKNALVIKDVDASCGCINIDYSHKPVKPNENAVIKVKYTADNTGFFNKSLSIVCNTEDSPIGVFLRGVAE